MPPGGPYRECLRRSPGGGLRYPLILITLNFGMCVAMNPIISATTLIDGSSG